MEPIALHDGRILDVHSIGDCAGWHCSIHNPSNHPLMHAPLDWFDSIGMMRRCEHGLSHPDPDDIEFKMITGHWIMVEAINSVHMMEGKCDGCCHNEPCS